MKYVKVVVNIICSINMEISMLTIMHSLTSMNYNFFLFGVFWFSHLLYSGKGLLRKHSLMG